LARWFRLYEKKRGGRRTGSARAARAGEALFYGLLLSVGLAALAILTVHWVVPRWQSDGSTWSVWLVLLVPGSFITIGGGGLVRTLIHWRTSTERAAALTQRASQFDPFAEADQAVHYPTVPSPATITDSPGTQLAFRLPASATPGWRLFGAAAFCLLCNAIGIAFVVLAVNHHLDGRPDWLLDVLAAPCAAAAVWSVYLLMRQLLITTGVGPTLVEIAVHPLYPNEVYAVLVSQSGRLKVHRLDVLLVCEEVASYRQGTDIRTEYRQVYEELALTCHDFEIDPAGPFSRQLLLRVPAGAMHSFKSGHNEIDWHIVVRGDAAGWPPFERRFPVVVCPPRSEGRRE
jgi:hypothetical protein